MRREWMMTGLVLTSLACWYLGIRPPAGRTRAEFVRLLADAAARGTSPREEARRQGWNDRELGRAAYHWGDLATERALAGILIQEPGPASAGR